MIILWQKGTPVGIIIFRTRIISLHSSQIGLTDATFYEKVAKAPGVEPGTKLQLFIIA